MRNTALQTDHGAPDTQARSTRPGGSAWKSTWTAVETARLVKIVKEFNGTKMDNYL